MTDTPIFDSIDKPAIVIAAPVFTEDDELGPVPEADMTGDQTDGLGAL